MSIIVEPMLQSFLEKSIQYLRIETKTVPCRRCREPIQFPLTARQGDIEAFQELLDIAKEFLAENGILEVIIERLWERVKQRKNIQ